MEERVEGRVLGAHGLLLDAAEAALAVLHGRREAVEARALRLEFMQLLRKGLSFMMNRQLALGFAGWRASWDATVADTAIGRIGVGICFDMRFPELAAVCASRGASMLVYPGAFNTVTGPLHWELLQRARRR